MIHNQLGPCYALRRAPKNSMKVFYICPSEYSQKILLVSLTIRGQYLISYFFLDVLNFENEILFWVDAFRNSHLLCENDNLVALLEIVPEDIDMTLWSIHKFPVIWILRKLLTRFSWNDCWILKISEKYFSLQGQGQQLLYAHHWRVLLLTH